MKHCHLYITANPLSVKSCFSSYVSKCSWPIRLQDYLKCLFQEGREGPS